MAGKGGGILQQMGMQQQMGQMQGFFGGGKGKKGDDSPPRGVAQSPVGQTGDAVESIPVAGEAVKPVTGQINETVGEGSEKQ